MPYTGEPLPTENPFSTARINQIALGVLPIVFDISVRNAEAALYRAREIALLNLAGRVQSGLSFEQIARENLIGLFTHYFNIWEREETSPAQIFVLVAFTDYPHEIKVEIAQTFADFLREKDIDKKAQLHAKLEELLRYTST